MSFTYAVDLVLLQSTLRSKCLSVIAEEAGISVKTLNNWRDGKVKLPRYSSLVRVLPLLKLKLTVIEIK